MVDCIQICLYRKASRLNHLTYDLDILRSVRHGVKLQPINLMHLACIELVISCLHTTNKNSNGSVDQLSEQVFSFVLQINVVLELLRNSILNLLVQLWNSL